MILWSDYWFMDSENLIKLGDLSEKSLIFRGFLKNTPNLQTLKSDARELIRFW